jgi:large subunit ribosomal protein L33
MSKAKKLGQMLVKMVSTAGTNFFYVTSKNPRNVPEKLKRVKFDPRVGKHVLFVESKLSR